MKDFYRLFHPIIAKPGNTERHVELPPTPALAPYIACFWGNPFPSRPLLSDDSPSPKATIIIPDTCMDIIFSVNYSTGAVHTVFCGINDSPFLHYSDPPSSIISFFGIRFYCWAVPLFTDVPMTNALNSYADVTEYFSDFQKQLESIFTEKQLIQERIPYAEAYLLNRLQQYRPIQTDVLCALHRLLAHRGLSSPSELSAALHLSPRQLQRLFRRWIGVSPKQLADLIRFQSIWRDLYHSPNQQLADLALRYQYADQAHFQNDFKKYAWRTPKEAILYSQS